MSARPEDEDPRLLLDKESSVGAVDPPVQAESPTARTKAVPMMKDGVVDLVLGIISPLWIKGKLRPGLGGPLKLNMAVF